MSQQSSRDKNMTNRNRQAQEREQLQVSRVRREVHFEEQYPRGGNAQG